MRITRHALFALIVGAGMTSPLAAQDPPPPPPNPPMAARARLQRQQQNADGAERPMRPAMAAMAMGGMGGMGPMMRAPAGVVSMMLNQTEQLNLTEDQVTKLKALQQAAIAKAEPSQSAMMRLQADLMDATKGDPNLDAARVALDKISKAQNDAAIANLKVKKDARDILTPGQRAQFDEMEARMTPRPPGDAGPTPDGALGRGGRGGFGGGRGGARRPPPPPPGPPGPPSL